VAQKYIPVPWHFPYWQREYEALISETDEKRLPELAAALENALFVGMQTLAPEKGTTEQKAIQSPLEPCEEFKRRN
jgi:hypothetical protein